MRKLLICGAAAMLATLTLSADDYQFIISGDPVAAASVGSKAVASPGTSLVTGALTASAGAVSLEARYRTWYESDGTALRSDKANGLILFIK